MITHFHYRPALPLPAGRLSAAKPYPNSGTNKEGAATIGPIALLLREKTGTSATDMHIVDIRSAALLKIPVNTPIPILGQPGVILEIYLSYT